MTCSNIARRLRVWGQASRRMGRDGGRCSWKGTRSDGDPGKDTIEFATSDGPPGSQTLDGA